MQNVFFEVSVDSSKGKNYSIKGVKNIEKLEDCARKNLTKKEMEIVLKELEKIAPNSSCEMDSKILMEDSNGNFFMEKPTQNPNKKVIIESEKL